MGYLYLFTALAGSSCPPSGCLEPSAGEVRVAYNFTLTRCHLTSPVLLYIPRRDEAGSNAYKDVYALDNRREYFIVSRRGQKLNKKPSKVIKLSPTTPRQ